MSWRQAVPNSLTLLRLLLAPMFPFAPSSWRLPMLAIGLLTEYLDGYLARRWDGASDFGRVLDPIADKVFVFSVMLVLVMEGFAGPAEMALVMTRDIVVLIAGLWFFLSGGRREQMPRVEPTLLGKVTTAFQILYLIGLLVFEQSHSILLVPTVGLSIWSSLDYFRRYRDVLVPGRRT